MSKICRNRFHMLAIAALLAASPLMAESAPVDSARPGGCAQDSLARLRNLATNMFAGDTVALKLCFNARVRNSDRASWAENLKSMREKFGEQYGLLEASQFHIEMLPLKASTRKDVIKRKGKVAKVTLPKVAFEIEVAVEDGCYVFAEK